MTPRSLLLVQLHYLGDVLLATPALRAARRAFPDARIDFVTGTAGADALEGNPHVDRVIRFERGVRGRLRTLRTLYGAGYDAVADFHSQPSSAQFVAATRAPVRIGLVGRGPRNLAYTKLLPRERGPVYMALQKLRMLAPLDVDPAGAGSCSHGTGDSADAGPDLRLELALSDADRTFARDIFSRHGLDGDAPVVAVSAVARHAFKQWGAERWAALADQIAGAGARVLLTHGPGEEEQVATVVARMRHEPVWRYGGTSIRQLAAVYARCDLWVGNDGGPKHLAVAAGTHTISIVRRGLGPVWCDLRPGSDQQAIEPTAEPGAAGRTIGGLETVRVDEVADAVVSRLESVRGFRR